MRESSTVNKHAYLTDTLRSRIKIEAVLNPSHKRYFAPLIRSTLASCMKISLSVLRYYFSNAAIFILSCIENS